MWNMYRFMFFLFSGVEQWMCCMILFCDMLYVLLCFCFLFSVNCCHPGATSYVSSNMSDCLSYNIKIRIQRPSLT
jgi:hypothetical protein